MEILVEDRTNVPDVLPDGTDLRPYKRLAAAVLDVALSDASSKPASPYTIDARRFLSRKSPLLQHWCRLAAVNQEQLLGFARKRRWCKNGQNGRAVRKSRHTRR
ncbi:MAG: hypothetical protein ACE5K9_09540 [Candidatus Methylomirabilales bacterium]